MNDPTRFARNSTSRRSFLRLAAAAAGTGVVASGARGATPSQWFGVSGWNAFRSVTRADDGYLLTGIQTNADDEQVGWAVRLDDDLETVWERTYQSPPHLTETDVGEDHDGFEFAIRDGDGGFLLVGWWHTLGSDSRFGWLVRIDGRGRVRWSRTYRRPGVNSFRDDFAGGVRTDDGFLLVGRTIASEFLDDRSGDGWVVSMSKNGRVRWQRAYNTENETNGSWEDDDRHDALSAVVAVDDGYLAVGEASPDGPTESSPTAGWAVRLDADGDVRWSRTYRSDPDAKNEFRDVVSTDDGYVFAGVAGETESVTELHDYQMRGSGWVLGVDGRGRRQWEDDGGSGFHAVAPSASGVLVAGRRNGRGWAVEYDGDGERTGRTATESARDSAYTAVARTPDGHLLAGYGRQSGETNALVETVEAGDDADGGDEDDEHLLEIVATERGDVNYQFTVDGTVEGVRVDDKIKAESNDAITENDDGTVTVSGFTGNAGYGDAFRFTGDIQYFERTGGDADFFVRLDGDRVDPEELADDDRDSHLFEIVASEWGEVEYRFTVDGAVEKVRLNGRVKAENNDVVTENDDGTVTVSGFTGNEGFGDAFRFTGSMTDFERTSGDADFFVRLDGERVSVDDLLD
ncbi:hypothetical protein [Halobacterium hubeiense]|uniref:hypothetical protein n=1 Tax=Halobacterium hubeiense TaxID=1407499 RepID=UPI003C7301B4